jgi:hypothetical protein
MISKNPCNSALLRTQVAVSLADDLIGGTDASIPSRSLAPTDADAELVHLGE